MKAVFPIIRAGAVWGLCWWPELPSSVFSRLRAGVLQWRSHLPACISARAGRS